MTLKQLLSLVVLGTAASHADGAIIYSGLQNLPIPFTFAGIYVNPLTLATSFSQPADFNTAPWFNLDFGGVDISNGDILRPVVSPTGVVLDLPSWSLVDMSSTFAAGAHASSTHIGPAPEQFLPGDAGYFGFAFSPTVGGPTHYGWAHVILRDNGTPGTLFNWAYEDVAGAPITVGIIPEPTTASLLGLSAAALLRRKRRAGRQD